VSLILFSMPLSGLCQIKIPAKRAALIPTEVPGDTAVVIPYGNAVEYFNLKSRLWPAAVGVIDSLRQLSAVQDSLISGQKEEIRGNKMLLVNETLARQNLETTLANADQVLRKKSFALRFWRLWGLTMTGVAAVFAVAYAVK